MLGQQAVHSTLAVAGQRLTVRVLVTADLRRQAAFVSARRQRRTGPLGRLLRWIVFEAPPLRATVEGVLVHHLGSETRVDR